MRSARSDASRRRDGSWLVTLERNESETRQAGLGRESLYKALSPEGNPELAAALKVMRALGLRLHASVG